MLSDEPNSTSPVTFSAPTMLQPPSMPALVPTNSDPLALTAPVTPSVPPMLTAPPTSAGPSTSSVVPTVTVPVVVIEVNVAFGETSVGSRNQAPPGLPYGTTVVTPLSST